jgi:hypothetical protein
MVGLLFHYEEDTIFNTSLSLWDEVKKCWGFDELICVDLAGRFPKRKLTYPTMAQAIEHNPNYQYIYLLNKRYIDSEFELLHNFKHPIDDVVYIIGSDSFGISLPLDMRNNSKIVSIKTATPQDTNHPIWAIEVATAIGYDRFIKKITNG